MVMIIAEIGVNHNGCPSIAGAHVKAAAKAGADAVKFQMFSADALEPPGPRRDMLRPLQLEPSDFMRLSQFTHEMGMKFIVTPFGPEQALYLVESKIADCIKIASPDIINLDLIRLVSGKGMPVLMSTGMADWNEIDAAANTVFREDGDLTLMHCVSAYPCPVAEANLSKITALKEYAAGMVDIGYSDHTMETFIPAAAVAMGATVIEKHFTIDNRLPGPDHRMSLNPEDFRTMVRQIGAVDMAMSIPRDDAESDCMVIREERRQWRETHNSG